MTSSNASEAAKAVVRRNTEEVQGGGNFAVFEELFANDFLDHTPQPSRTPDKAGARELYKVLRAAFPDFHAEIPGEKITNDHIKSAADIKTVKPAGSSAKISRLRCRTSSRIWTPRELSSALPITRPSRSTCRITRRYWSNLRRKADAGLTPAQKSDRNADARAAVSQSAPSAKTAATSKDKTSLLGLD